MDRIGKASKLERQNIRIRQTQDHCSGRLGKEEAIGEIGIQKMRVVIEVVVDRVVLATLVLATVPNVDAGYPEVVEKYRIVGPGSQRADTQVGARPHGGSPLLRGPRNLG